MLLNFDFPDAKNAFSNHSNEQQCNDIFSKNIRKQRTNHTNGNTSLFKIYLYIKLKVCRIKHLTGLPKYIMILMKNFLKKMTKVLLALCRIKLYQNNVFSHENRKSKKTDCSNILFHYAWNVFDA